jgi:hypothetical protein
MKKRLDEIKTKWNIPVTLPMTVPWGKDDVVWLVQEVERLRAKVRTITEHYKPGWVDGLKAVARNAGFDPDDAPHDGVDPPTFIEDVIDLLRRDVRDLKAENERLREALADIARGDYSDPLCMKTPEQRAREALTPTKGTP